MALINPQTGQYAKVNRVTTDSNFICTADMEIYVNKEHRLNPSNYPQYMVLSSHINNGALQTELTKTADSSLSIIDNFKKATYAAIKADNFELSSWADDI